MHYAMCVFTSEQDCTACGVATGYFWQGRGLAQHQLVRGCTAPEVGRQLPVKAAGEQMPVLWVSMMQAWEQPQLLPLQWSETGEQLPAVERLQQETAQMFYGYFQASIRP